VVLPLWVLENRPSPLLWPLAYTTACTTVQAVISKSNHMCWKYDAISILKMAAVSRGELLWGNGGPPKVYFMVWAWSSNLYFVGLVPDICQCRFWHFGLKLPMQIHAPFREILEAYFPHDFTIVLTPKRSLGRNVNIRHIAIRLVSTSAIST